ncbi:MAG: hypothetical protein U0R66_17410 [Mycobacterium sp.]
MIDPTAEIARSAAVIDELYYRLTRASLLRVQLLSARMGVLDVDWRTSLLDAVAEPLEDIGERHQQLLLQAAEDVANLPNADWEPDMKAGWREALEAWFAATKRCLDEMEDAQRRIHAEAGLPVNDLAAGFAMDRDLETASYRAGLTAAGLVSNWFEWLGEKVQAWPHGPRRENQLQAMADPDYRRQLQQLPRYWA